VGTMNPEEGDLRPQLLDRFALCVDIQSIHQPDERVDILQRIVQFERDPAQFYTEWNPRERELSQVIENARPRVADVTYSRHDLHTIAWLSSEMHVDGHRADIVILKTAIAHAAYRQRDQIMDEDIIVAAELALPHRLKRQPFQDTELRFQDLTDQLGQARQAADQQSQQKPQDSVSVLEEKKTQVR